MSKRSDVEAAALELFARRGVDGTSIRQIAERADTAEGNIYRHFADKDELVRTLFETCAGRFHDLLRRHAEGIVDPDERMSRLVAAIFVFAENHPQAFSYLLTVHRHVLERTGTEEEPAPFRLFVDTIRSGIAAGHFRPVPPPLAAAWILGMSQRAITMADSGLIASARPDLVSETVEAAHRLLRADRPPPSEFEH